MEPDDCSVRVQLREPVTLDWTWKPNLHAYVESVSCSGQLNQLPCVGRTKRRNVALISLEFARLTIPKPRDWMELVSAKIHSSLYYVL